MMKLLVSNTGIFAQKSKVFNGPLHFKDHAILIYDRAHMRGAVTDESLLTVSIISWRGFVFNMTKTFTRRERSQWGWEEIPPNV